MDRKGRGKLKARRAPAVGRVLERVTLTAREHAMFEPGRLVLVAVSGGPDSVCLVHALVKLHRLFKMSLAVFHFDHSLREGSREDAAYVRELSAVLDLPFYLRIADSEPTPGESIEAWARDRRMSAARSVANEVGAERIAVGHTLDDQAETVLMNLIRGSGLAGLAGIAPVSGPLVQPLINVTRDEVEEYCSNFGLEPRLDPMNVDPRYLRSAIRLNGLPALERTLGRGLREPIVRTAALVREDADFLDRQTLAVVAEVARDTPEGVELDAVRLLALPRAIAGRVASHAVFASGAVCTQADVRAILELAGGRSGRSRDLSTGLKARRGREYVHLSRPSPKRS